MAFMKKTFSCLEKAPWFSETVPDFYRQYEPWPSQQGQECEAVVEVCEHVCVCVCVCVHISEHMHTPSTCLCEINMAEVSLNAEQSRFCPSLALRSSETIKLHHSGNSEALRNTNYKSCKLYSKMCYS